MRLCSIAGCDKRHVAKSLCKTHYNQTTASRHRRIVSQCPGCGEQITRSSRSTRWENSYCSKLCQHWHKYATPMMSTLPETHWARMYGRTSEWRAPNLTVCDWCSASVRGLSRSARFCARDCKTKAGKQRRRAAEFNAEGTYKWSEITHLWRDFDKCCAYCRQPITLS